MDERRGEVSERSGPKLVFELLEKVKVTELERPGVVISAHISRDGVRYEVRYFWDGVAREVYFYEWELEAL